MQQARTREQLWSVLRPWRLAGQSTALVPTMGNLHDGHLALVAAARQHADRVIVSIYVNPAQFGAGEDFSRYPRTLEDDLQRLEAAQCDLAFLPDDRAIYPLGLDGATQVRAAPALANVLEGAFRPGHFDGVVTVVARLLNLAAPAIAVFGEKDFQQLLVIRRLVEDRCVDRLLGTLAGRALIDGDARWGPDGELRRLGTSSVSGQAVPLDGPLPAVAVDFVALEAARTDAH